MGAYGLISVLQLLVCAGAGCDQTVTAIFFLQSQYAPARSERFGRILHDAFHFPKIIQHYIVHFRGTPEKFFQILVIRTIVSRQVVFLFP